MDHPVTGSPATARDIILEIVRNMREGLEPLHYSTLPPAVFNVYLHAADYERLRGILPRVEDEARRALDAELVELNKVPLAEKLKLARREGTRVTPPGAGWQVRFLENTEDETRPGDIVIYSELALPAKTDLGAGSMTKRIATRRMGGETTATARYESHPPPTASGPATGEKAYAVIRYQDSSGAREYRMCKDTIVVGRGGRDYWTDLKLNTAPDISREHLRLRRDPATGQFFLKDLSRLGTTVDGVRTPSSIEFDESGKRDKNVETPLPLKARIGLADVVYLEFEATGER